MRFLSFLRAPRSESSSATGSAAQTAASTTSADDSTASMSFGPTLSAHGSMPLYPSVANLPQTRRLVVEQSLNCLLNERHFSICRLNDIADVLGANRNTDAFRLLRTLHCMDYTAMTPQMREALPQLINEALRPLQAKHPATDVVMQGLDFGGEVQA